MASKWKTFASGEVLTAADVNDTLNPSTAPHVPRSVAAGIAGVDVAASGSGYLDLTFPVGRFSTAPSVNVDLVTNYVYASDLRLVIRTITKDLAQVRIFNTGTATHTGANQPKVSWTAIQI